MLCAVVVVVLQQSDELAQLKRMIADRVEAAPPVHATHLETTMKALADNLSNNTQALEELKRRARKSKRRGNRPAGWDADIASDDTDDDDDVVEHVAPPQPVANDGATPAHAAELQAERDRAAELARKAAQQEAEMRRQREEMEARLAAEKAERERLAKALEDEQAVSEEHPQTLFL